MSSTYVPFKLNNERDADILAAIADAPDKSARLRELIRQGLSVTRNTAEPPKTVLRNTEIVTRNTFKPEPPQPTPAENPPAGSGNGKTPQFVPPEGFAMMSTGEQKRIRNEWFAAQEKLRSK